MLDVNCLNEKLQDENCDWIEDNISRQVTIMRKRVTAFVRAASRHKRTAATHVLVIMISPEERNAKPYALPVQCIPYKGLSDSKVRELVNVLIHEMTKKGMK